MSADAPPEQGAFAKGWHPYSKAGLAPVPAMMGEKRPATKRPRGKLGEATLATMAAKFPANPIGIWTGEISGLTVIDVDKGDGSIPITDLVKAVEAKCGTTPCHVKTASDGRHLWYAYTPGDKSENPIGAKRRAFPVDVKAQGGFVMAPGSPGYVFDRGNLADVARLPRVNRGSLPLHREPRGVERQITGDTSPATFRRLQRGEGRNSAMLQPLYEAAWFAETREDFERDAARIEAQICEGPYEDLPRLRDHIWRKKMAGDLVEPIPRGVPFITISIPDLERYASNPFALTTLAVFKAKHGARPGKRFAASPRAMVGSALMKGWKRRWIELGLKALTADGGAVRQVKKGGRGKGDASQYELVPLAMRLERKGDVRSVVPADGTNITRNPPLPQGATTTASGPARGQARLGGKPPSAPRLPVPESFVSAGFHASPAVPGGSVVEHLQHPANQSNLEGGVIRRARIFGEASEQMAKPKPVPADPWGGFVERVTRHHGMTRDEAWTVATAIGGDDVPAAVLACLAAAEAAGRSARADLMAHHPDAPKAEDPAGGLVREPVQTDWVEQISGDKRAAVPTQTEAREWLAEQRLSQRQAAMLAGMPSGTFQTWINGRRPLPPEHAARLWAAMNATKAA